MSVATVFEQATCGFHFQALTGVFVDFAGQAQHHTGFQTTTLHRLGLIDDFHQEDGFSSSNLAPGSKSKPWDRFQAYVADLNARDPGRTSYKVLYVTRHGLGFHNAFMSSVSRDAWNNHWSHLDGDGEIIWADAQLNKDGVEQAKSLGRFWSDAVAEEKVPFPETIYTSPLARCLETTRLVFGGGVAKRTKPPRVIVKELLRERLTDHTCDRRSSKSWIAEHYPNYIIEPEFSENDKLWRSDHFESTEEHAARAQSLLDDIFESDSNTYIALTTHSYAISAILGAVNSPEFRVREGSSIALLVKATRAKQIEKNES